MEIVKIFNNSNNITIKGTYETLYFTPFYI